MHRAGRLNAAEQGYRQAHEAGDDHPALPGLLGALLIQTGRHDEAVPWLKQALTHAPGDDQVRLNLGVALTACGRDVEAFSMLRPALLRTPDHATGAAALVMSCTRLGETQTAENLCTLLWDRTRRADTRIRLARLLSSLGRGWTATGRLSAQANRGRLSSGEQRVLCELVGGADLTENAAALNEAVAACLHPPGAPLHLIGAAFTHMLELRLPDAGDERLSLFAEPAVRDGMGLILLMSPRLEARLARLRRRLLMRVRDGAPPADGEADAAIALARQCWLNEHIWPVDQDEAETLARLRRGLASRSDETALEALRILAAYGSLKDLAGAHRLGASPLALDRELARLHLDNPEAEAEIRTGIPVLGPPADPTSRAVARQYEENPYPRWAAPDLPEPATSSELARLCGAHALPERLRILVAGCGTGHQAVRLAAQHPDADILAVDLSAASLAYAARMAEIWTPGRVRFLQADILDLDQLELRFDYIACSGVLHHMKAPEEGLAALSRRLEPGGVMALGLYSAAAREGVARVREWAAGQGLGADVEDIRRLRDWVMSQPPDDPARAIMRFPDFHCVSGCRDLALHVMEHAYDLQGVGALLSGARLRFSGFQSLAPDVEAAYRRAFPHDPALRDLDAWSRFEAAHPMTFAGMYEFWAVPEPGVD